MKDSFSGEASEKLTNLIENKETPRGVFLFCGEFIDY